MVRYNTVWVFHISSNIMNDLGERAIWQKHSVHHRLFFSLICYMWALEWEVHLIIMYKHIFLASGSTYCIVNLSDPASPNCQTMADISPPTYLQKHLSNPSHWATSWTQSAHWPPCFGGGKDADNDFALVLKTMLTTRHYTVKNKTQPNNNQPLRWRQAVMHDLMGTMLWMTTTVVTVALDDSGLQIWQWWQVQWRWIMEDDSRWKWRQWRITTMTTISAAMVKECRQRWHKGR